MLLLWQVGRQSAAPSPNPTHLAGAAAEAAFSQAEPRKGGQRAQRHGEAAEIQVLQRAELQQALW